MDVRRNRGAEASGLAFVALTVVAGLLAGRPPDSDDAGAIGAFLDDGSLVWSGAIGGTAGFLFLWFVGAHQDHLRRLAPDRPLVARVALAAATVTLGLVLLSVVVLAGLAVAMADPGTIDPETARRLYVIALVSLAGATYPTTAAFVSAGSVAVLLAADRARAPRWLGWAGLALAGGQLVAGFTIASDHRIYGLGGLFPGAVFLTFLTWVVATSITMVSRLDDGHLGRQRRDDEAAQHGEAGRA